MTNCGNSIASELNHALLHMCVSGHSTPLMPLFILFYPHILACTWSLNGIYMHSRSGFFIPVLLGHLVQNQVVLLLQYIVLLLVFQYLSLVWCGSHGKYNNHCDVPGNVRRAVPKYGCYDVWNVRIWAREMHI